ncbi:MAG: hypothetical protein J6U20_14855 [Fibrobacter sp.]|nr:hypothetical protein [Fibrobacter sp.]
MMYLVICFLLSFLISCSSSSDKEEVTSQGTVTPSETNQIEDKYPGFYQNAKCNYFFDRHPYEISSTSFEIEDYEKDDQGNIVYDNEGYPKKKKTKRNIKLDYGESNVVVEEGQTSYVNVYVSWNPQDEYDVYKDVKYYICDANSLKEIETIDFSYQIPETEWNIGHKEKEIEFYSQAEKIGLCSRYKDLGATLYDVLNAYSYELRRVDVLIAEIGGKDDNKRTNIENEAKPLFAKAATEISFSKEEYPIPESYREDNLKHRSVSSFANGMLFVSIAKKGGGKSSCYDRIKDDMFWSVDLAKKEIRNGVFGRRFLLNFNRGMVKYWTFDNNRKLCNDGLAFVPEENITYQIGIINSSKWDCRDPQFWRFRVNSDKMGEIEIDGSWTTELSVIDPDCHVVYNEKDGNNGAVYWDSFFNSNDEGFTDEVTDALDGPPIGLYSVVRSSPNEKNWRTYAHEIGHLMGLSDVTDPDDKNKKYEGNLMHAYASESKGKMLRKGPLPGKISPSIEYQWDCLHTGHKDHCIKPSWHSFPGDY